MDDADRAEIEIERAMDLNLAKLRERAQPVGPPRLGADGARLCLGCGEPICARRLAAAPAAVRCVGCQADAERGRP
jgi:phage/conjugal plasmid C-4 type zinc finger TraR family protein